MYPFEEINLSGEAATDFALYLLELNKQFIKVTSKNSEKLRKIEAFKIEMAKIFDTFYFQKNAQEFSSIFYVKQLKEISQIITGFCEKDIQFFFEKHSTMLFESSVKNAFDDIAMMIGKKVAIDKYDSDEPVVPQRKLDRDHHNLLVASKKIKAKVFDKETNQFKRIVVARLASEKNFYASSIGENPESESFIDKVTKSYEKMTLELNGLRKEYFEKMALFNIGLAEQVVYNELKQEFPKERKHSSIPLDGQEDMFAGNNHNN